MILNLHVKNFALIDEIDIDFTDGLNILTGETGAGKSVILGSLNIALGSKADKDLIRTGCDHALVDITFLAKDKEIIDKLNEYDIETVDDTVTIQRKILAQRSTFRINGENVSAAVVKDIALVLIDVYGQHDYQNLLNHRKHIEFLDSYAYDDLKATLDQYKNTYNEYLRSKALIESPQIDEVKREREISVLEFQIEEIESAGFHANEEEEVLSKLKILENASKIRDSLMLIKSLIAENNENASDMISQSLKELSGISSFDNDLNSLYEDLNSVNELIFDFERRLSGMLDDYMPDEEELYNLRQRYDLINNLERKYGKTLEDVLGYLSEKQKELDDLKEYGNKRQACLDEFEKIKNRLDKEASKLSALRKKASVKFKKDMEENLKFLNFNQSLFDVKIEETDDFTANGKDKVNFLISVNPGEALKPLESVSSGGELSRIMLALKTLGVKNNNSRTLIFDEIDAGISGITAWKVAKKLAVLSTHNQIICITHLQQIASMADIHFEIRKEVSDDHKTFTYINKLDEEGEIREISRMLGDEFESDKFKENAIEIKKQAIEFKKSIISL